MWDEGTSCIVNRNGRLTRGTARWRVPWNQALPLAQALLGGSQGAGVVPGTSVSGTSLAQYDPFSIADAAGNAIGSGTTTIYTNGLTCPAFFGLTALEVEIVGDGIISQDVSGFAKYERAELLINFGYPEYADGDKTTNISQIELTPSVLSVPISNAFKFPDTTTADQKTTIEVMTGDFVKTLYNRAYLNTSKFLPYYNAVNTTKFLGVDKGQVLFLSPDSRSKLTPVGLPNWDIDLHFRYHPIADGWNSLPQAGKNPLWQLVKDGNGNTEHPYMELNDLLTKF